MTITTKTAERALRSLLYAALLTPAVFLPWLAHPFTFGKISYFMLIIACAAALFALLLFRGTLAPRAPLFTKILFAYFALLALAAAFGVDPARSFWAESERMTGLVTGIFLLAFLMMMIAAVRTDALWRRVFVFSVFTGLVVAASALLELVSPFMRRLFGDVESIRLSGPIGNPIYLGVYLLPVIGMATLLAAGARGRAARTIWIAAAVFLVAVVVLTGSRGAGVGFVLGMMTGLGAACALARTRRARLAFGASTLVAVVCIAFTYALLTRTSVGVRVPALQRLVSYSARDFGPRKLNWEMTLRGIRERPLIGWGPENYLYVFDRHYRPELLRYGPVEASSDKPHNGFLEIMLTGGASALALYLAVWVILAASLIRGARRASVPVAAASVGIGVAVGYLFSLFFGFETPASQVPLYTLLAYSAYVLRPAAAPTTAREAPTVLRGATAGLAAAGLLIVFYVGIARAFPAFTAAARASEAAYRTPAVFADAYRRATARQHPYAGELVRELSRDFILWEGRGTYPEKAVGAALPAVTAAVDEAIRREPENFFLRYERGQIALIAKDYAVAEAAFARAGELSPRRQAVTYMQAKVLLLTGRQKEAVALLKSLIDADPMVGQSHWFYALALIETGERRQALEELELSRETGRGMTTREKLYYIDLLAAEGLYERVANLYEGLAESEPGNPLWHARLAATYAAMGRLDLAIFEAERAAEIDPSYAQTRDEFIQKLPKQ